MEQDELQLLLTARMLAAIDAEAGGHGSADPFARSTALRRAGFSAAETAAILTQADLRRRARVKFGPAADHMLLTRAGLEQATRRDVAGYHAARIAAISPARVVDLTCGIGGDAMRFAECAAPVLAVERDPVVAALARFNLAPFPSATVVQEAAESTSLHDGDAVWLDPARRTAGHSGTRRVGPADYSPALDFVLGTAARASAGVKLSPAHDRGALPDDVEAQWVSHGGETVELVLWSGALRRRGVRRAALVLRDGVTAELTGASDAADEPVAPLGAFVHEPEGAVIRAGLLGDLARRTGTRPVGPGIAYLTGDDSVTSPLMTSFAVDEVLPFDRKRIASALRARGVGRLEIKKRGVDLDPAAYRRGLGLRGDSEAVLIVTRADDRRIALLGRRLLQPGR